MDDERYEVALQRLAGYVERHAYRGWDLYDGLKCIPGERLLHVYLLNTVVTQLFKRNPVNLRRMAGITPTRMPKALGIFLQGYALLIESETDAGRLRAWTASGERLVALLDEAKVPGYHGTCWTFGFPYKQMYHKPTAVITAIVAKGLFHFHRVTGHARAGALLAGTRDFFLRDLVVTETPNGRCYSYTPGHADCCYNANMLVAETLARVAAVTGDTRPLDAVEGILEYTLHHQHADGRWNYSIDPRTQAERPQVDFHQGYVLESLHETMALTGGRFSGCRDALVRGTAFYRQHQFFEDGRAKWRIPKTYPIDIHNQAQAVILFTLLRHLDPGYGPFARRVADWTLDHMRGPDGSFVYQVHRLYTNRIRYMRWAQAWMFLALARLRHAARSPSPADPQTETARR